MTQHDPLASPSRCRRRLAAALPLCLLLASASARGQAEPPSGARRFALLVGANDGGPDRVTLRYALGDARAFEQVLRQLGGVQAQDASFLQQPDAAGLSTAFEDLGARIQAARARGERVELIFYYSGHSDEVGLRLRDEVVTYRELRALIDDLPADVRIGVLDSCASGALTRLKGGTRRPPFLVDRSTDVRGHAFLTSSSESEAAQESDRVGASFFTHYLVSGLRGAADYSGDGRVTLNEAYRFAFDETLARTETTQGGAQHAAYDIQLAGTGDVVMTDLSQTSASLTFVRKLEGRLFIRDQSGRLVAELYKPAGRAVELGLPPGRYRITAERGEGVARADITLAEASSAMLAPDALAPVPREAARARGDRGEPAGGDYRLLPFSSALFYPIDSNAVEQERKVVNLFSLNLLYGRAARTHGVALGSGVNRLDEGLHGLQLAAAANVVGGRVVGAQLAGGANLAGGDVSGPQLSGGANLAGGDVSGLQTTAGANVAGGRLAGAQLSAGFNYAAAGEGLQSSAGVSAAGELSGLQLSSVNYAGQLDGVQLGLINVAGRVGGLQLGLINYADEADAQLGLLSFTREGGASIQVWSSDTALANLALRLDARHTYGFVAAGLHPVGEDDGYLLGFGFGGKLPLRGRFHVELDGAWYSVQYDRAGLPFDNVRSQLVQARLLARYELTTRLSIFGGPTFNLLIARRSRDFGRRIGYGFTLSRDESEDRELSLWPGFVLGAQL